MKNKSVQVNTSHTKHLSADTKAEDVLASATVELDQNLDIWQNRPLFDTEAMSLSPLVFS